MRSFESQLESAQLAQLDESDPERVNVSYRIPPSGLDIITNPAFLALGILTLSTVLVARMAIKRMPKPKGGSKGTDGKEESGGMFGGGGPFGELKVCT